MASQPTFLFGDKTVAIISCPFSAGQARPGVDQGPLHLIDAGFINDLKGLGWKVKFDGHNQFKSINVPIDPDIGNMKNPRLVSQVASSVSQVVARHHDNGELPVTIGGDHSLAPYGKRGILNLALLVLIFLNNRKHPNACVIWIDAHADINKDETTTTGNMHGMPLSFLLGLESIQELSWLTPILKPENLVYIGLRDVDVGEKKILRDNKIKAFSMHEVDKYGIGEVVKKALDYVNPGRDKPIHLSFDVDALDPTVAPSTGTPVRGGLSFREGHYLCEAIYRTGLLVAFDLVEVNPTIGTAESQKQTVEVGRSLVRSALGETLLHFEDHE